LQLLNKTGISGYILPHKFFTSIMGEKIRSLITSNQVLKKIVHFGTNQIFENATTYTCLMFLSKKKNNEFQYFKFDLGENIKDILSHELSFNKIKFDELLNKEWNFLTGKEGCLLKKLKRSNLYLEDISQGIYKGSSTGNDSIFIVELIQKNDNLSIVQSKKLKEKFKIENNLLKPFLYGKDIKRYFNNHNNFYLIFPYTDCKFIFEDTFKINFPYAYKYFLNFKNKLLERKNSFSGGDFYKFSAARNLNKFKHIRILVPDILVENRISIDLNGEFLHGPAIHSLVLKKDYNISSKSLLALMNSKIFWFFIKNTSTALRGNAYRLVPEYLNPFPLPFLSKKDEKLTVYQKKSELIVDQMLEVQKKYHNAKTENEKTIYKKQIDILDNQIDQLVYKLYNLTDEEIRIVEGEGG